MKICSVENCSRKFYGKSLCHAHYIRQWRNGNIEETKPILSPYANLLERFKAKISPTPDENGCLNWIGCANRYGRFTVGSRKNGTRTTKSAHRLALELFLGEIPDGMHVLHICDNTRCVNVDHLFLGTQMDNMRDMISKGRDNKLKKAIQL